MTFHHVRFPTNISLGAMVSPQRRTEIVTLGSGYEERNSRWASSRRSYNAGYGIKTLDDLHNVLSFFEERRGQLYGFLWKDPLDHKSCLPSQSVRASDQIIATADGQQSQFQLVKQYGYQYAPWQRDITKVQQGSLLLAVDGQAQLDGTDYGLDLQTGKITFDAAHIPQAGQVISAGFAFDVPVRFDTDRLEINMSDFAAGQIPDIPLIEIRI